MGCAAIDIFKRAADLNRSDDRREGNVLVVPPPCRIVYSGDIHGNRRAFGKILSYAKLSSDQQCRLVLQEILHGQPDSESGQDRSIEILMRAARLKIEHPGQVLFVMGNHDLAQVMDSEISKYGHGACKAFVEGVRFAFANYADDVMEAVKEFLRSLPLAVRCPNGVFISHSLPSPDKCDEACIDILTRPITPDDMRRGQPAYNWVWGRRQTEDQLESLAARLEAEFFLLAHQHTEGGYNILSPRAAVVLSDHSGGYIAEFRDDEKMSGGSLVKYLKPLASL